MIDIHTHILPNVYDGSDSLETSIYLLKQEINEGITKVILTPHQNEECKNGKELKEKFELFKEEFKNYDIVFYLGSEIYYYPNMIKDLNSNNLLTFNNSKYVFWQGTPQHHPRQASMQIYLHRNPGQSSSQTAWLPSWCQYPVQ